MTCIASAFELWLKPDSLCNIFNSDMTPISQRELVLRDAAAKLTGAARSVFLDGACLVDPALRDRVEALLAAHESKPHKICYTLPRGR